MKYFQFCFISVEIVQQERNSNLKINKKFQQCLFSINGDLVLRFEKYIVFINTDNDNSYFSCIVINIIISLYLAILGLGLFIPIRRNCQYKPVEK